VHLLLRRAHNRLALKVKGKLLLVLSSFRLVHLLCTLVALPTRLHLKPLADPGNVVSLSCCCAGILRCSVSLHLLSIHLTGVLGSPLEALVARHGILHPGRSCGLRRGDTLSCCPGMCLAQNASKALCVAA